MFARGCIIGAAMGALLLCGSCIFCDTGDHFFVKGRVVSSDGEEPLVGVFLGGRLLTDEGKRYVILPFARFGDPRVAQPDEDGDFEIPFLTAFRPCRSEPAPPARPDRVEIIVVNDTCWREFSIEVNEQTGTFVQNEDRRVDRIELRDPIRVPSGTEGCLSCVGRLAVEGVLLVTDTAGPLSDAGVIVTMLTDGEKTAETFVSDPRNEPSAGDGRFEVTATGFGECVNRRVELPLPDTLEIRVTPNGCRVASSLLRFSIPIDDESVIDPTAPDHVLELRDPILVPPCPQVAKTEP